MTSLHLHNLHFELLDLFVALCLCLLVLVRYMSKLLVEARLLVLVLLLMVLKFSKYLEALLIVHLYFFIVALHLLVILQLHIELVVHGRKTA